MTDLLTHHLADCRLEERLRGAHARRLRAEAGIATDRGDDAHRLQRALVRASVLLLPDRDQVTPQG
jgi:hypothetical protein